MSGHSKTIELLRSLGDFDDPSSAAQFQTETLLAELQHVAATSPHTKFRVTEDGPERTISEILADVEAEEAEIDALKKAIKSGGHFPKL